MVLQERIYNKHKVHRKSNMIKLLVQYLSRLEIQFLSEHNQSLSLIETSMDRSEFMKLQVLMSKLNQLLILMLSLEHSHYNKCPNVRAVLPQISLGLAIISLNPENGEKSGNEIPEILHVVLILTWSRQVYLAIGHDMEGQCTYPSNFKRGGR